ncbi:hypothetical protein AwWohl_08980 [Gammaproteobacteria bacterium]|nr:hypothetical protein AwWohl_08980 [Gammaproteobacteria bacterium]
MNIKSLVTTLSALSVALVISGCLAKKQDTATVVPKVIDPVENISQELDPKWTTKLEQLKPAIRACLINQKAKAAVIRYGMPMNHGKAMIILADNAGNTSDCIADLGTATVVSVTASKISLSSDIQAFYPVGRSIAKCNQARVEKDSQNRVMGTVCTL